ncbi:MAG: zinc dependent phospholipase C family protein [Chloroflexi bacterium]|nr:zinc dependent phospholipase C family protein [Chloroflexota bacterium]
MSEQSRVARTIAVILLASFAFVQSEPSRCLAWGVAGHRLINGAAVDQLPAGPLRTLFKTHRSYLLAHSVDPDHWRSVSAGEGYHHYMDMDRYGRPPFPDLPRDRQAAERKFGAGTVLANGTVPWVVGEWFARCAADMRANDTSRLLMDAAVLGHYVADSHVPFHAVENYDGQMTGQKGIHARFEAMLVEHYVHPSDLRAGPIRYIDDPVEADFGWLVESAMLAPGVLAADRTVHARYPDYESSGFRGAFWKAVGPIVEQRLQEGASDLASVWQSAWIAAGTPPLSAPAAEIDDTAAAAGVPHDVKPLPAR